MPPTCATCGCSIMAFPIRDALRPELSWTHYRLLLRVDRSRARQWYMHEAAAQNWSTRVLERQIGTLYYERLLSSQDKALVLDEAAQTRALHRRRAISFAIRSCWNFSACRTPASCWKRSWRLALMDKLQAFLLELGKGFAFVARQQRISTETQGFLHRPGLLQLPAEVFCADRPENRPPDPSGYRADGHVCAPV